MCKKLNFSFKDWILMWYVYVKCMKKIPYIWLPLFEHTHQRRQVVVFVWHYNLIYVVQQDVARPVHGSVNALIKRCQLAKVVQVSPMLWEFPSMRWIQILVNGPRNHLQEALLAVALQQAVELWATAGVIDHHPAHTQQPGARWGKMEMIDWTRSQKNKHFLI